MIEKGKKCTIHPDNQVQYEIIEVKKNNTVVDLKEVEEGTIFKDIPVAQINLLND